MAPPKVEAAKAFLKRHAPAIAGTAGAGLGFSGGYSGTHDFNGRERSKAERIRAGVLGAAIYGGLGYTGAAAVQGAHKAIRESQTGRAGRRSAGGRRPSRTVRIEEATRRLNQTGNDWAEETAKELKNEGKSVFVQKGDMTKQNSARVAGLFDEISKIYESTR